MVLVAIWNGVAVVLGLVGAINPRMRHRLARWTNLQASSAVALSIIALVLNGAVALFGSLFGLSVVPIGALFAALIAPVRN